MGLGVVGAGLGLPAGVCLRANGVKAFPTCITIPPFSLVLGLVSYICLVEYELNPAHTLP